MTPHQEQILRAIDKLKLTPAPLPTIGKPFLSRIWQWAAASRKWKVAEEWTIELNIKGTRQTILIPAGFVFDGASVPRLLWPLLSPTGVLLVPGLIHDYGYRLGHLLVADRESRTVEELYTGVSRHFWDSIFQEVTKQVTGCRVIAAVSWGMLSLFGGFAWWSNRKTRRH